MRNLAGAFFCATALSLTLTFSAPLSAQEVQEDPAGGLEAALSERAAEAASDGNALLRFLEREDVRDVASRRGIDLDRVRTAVRTLGADDLASLDDDIQQMDDLMAGGDRIVIASSTVIILLLILILVAVA